MKLSIKAIEAVKPTDKRQEYPDQIVKGLRLIVQPSGIKSFQLRYRYAGKGKRLTLGRVDKGITLAHARDKARDALLKVEDGVDPLSDRRTQLKQTVELQKFQISNLLKVYEQVHLSQLRTGDQAIYFLREFSQNYGYLNIDDFSRQDFVELTNGILMRGTGTKANRVFTHVKTFFNWAISQGHLEHNPCDRVKKPFKEKSRERFLSEEEIKLFWTATGSDLEPWGYLYRMLLLSGQRENEVARMTKDEIVTENHWHLSGERTKNKQQHDIYLPSQAVAIVHRNSRIDGGYIFSTTGAGPVRGFSKATKRLRERMNYLAGRELDNWQLHDLRRTCETGLAMLGTPQPIIDRITNHVTGRGMGRIYNQYEYKGEKSVALQKWADHVEGLVA